MQALHAAQFEFDNRLPCQVSETAEEAAQRAWVDNAVESLLDRQDVTFQRRLRKAQGVTQLDFAEAIDHFITDGGMDVSAGPAALGLLVLAGRSGVPCDVRTAAARVIPEAKLREIARELLEPLAADGVLAEAEAPVSPHILIDKELEALADPATPVDCAALMQRQLNAMMADQRITIPEFNHYCERLNKVVAGRMEAA